ncbi:MAG: indolepyruvate ferredoxin oxidoreductase subunit alpha [bacterium]|jgi:indolepyruvate ferredoxin oxidoreductase alpha subunit
MKVLMTGNEAIARGAFEAGVVFAAAYPGTPSTEILENIATYAEVTAQWAPNEKVALETGIGASFAGGRVLVAMKHVGVNVAADPLLTLAYTGVNGGLVLVSADDPGMHSSQNEQDNRHFGPFAKIPVLEPADSQEAKDFVGLALEISETFDTPVLLRITTRIAHGKSVVHLQDRTHKDMRPFAKDIAKYVMVPANARQRRFAVEERLKDLVAFSEKLPVNRIHWGKGRKVGIITSGISYQYLREVLGDQVSYLKLSLIYPLPVGLVTQFAESVEELYVVEELDPIIEQQVRAIGIKVKGKEIIPGIGELSPEIIAAAFNNQAMASGQLGRGVPARPPVLCPGCPHRGVFYLLNRLKVVVNGDIGCYALGAAPPLAAMHSLVCMGASISNCFGFMEVMQGRSDGIQAVAVIGDSTFLHSGIQGLLNVVYNGGSTTTLILDNNTTAMTGHQNHPGTGVTLKGVSTVKVDLENLCRAVGVEDVVTVDAYDLTELERAIKSALAFPGPSVVIVKRPCVLLPGSTVAGDYYQVHADICINCGACLKLGCPAIIVREQHVVIIQSLCTGCGLCAQVCPKKAIVKVGE